MFKRLFGLLAILIGLSLGGLFLYFAASGQAPELAGLKILKVLVLPGLLVAFGVTWLRGGTFGR